MSNNTNKNLEIESLRGIAVVLVMLSHLPVLLPFFTDFFVGLYFSKYVSWTGVDLFFCISGYVVSKAYMEKIDSYRLQGFYWLAIQNFFIRRAYRLFPSAWLWVLIGLMCSIFFNRSGVFAGWLDNLRSMAVILTFSANYANQYGLLLRPNDIYWSLSLEEQFYFLFPIFLFFVRSIRWRMSLLLILIALQFTISRNPLGTPAEAMASNFRLDGIMWGILIYMFSCSSHYERFDPKFLQSKLASAFVVGLLLYLLVAIPAELIKLPTALGSIAVVAALLVFMASFNKGYIAGFPLVSSLMTWIGARSYGMYLIHIFSYRFVYEFFTHYAARTGVALDASFAPWLALSALFLIFFLAELNYRFIEVPLRDYGAKITKQRERQFKAISPSQPIKI